VTCVTDVLAAMVQQYPVRSCLWAGHYGDTCNDVNVSTSCNPFIVLKFSGCLCTATFLLYHDFNVLTVWIRMS
jgi:hypothetical protein